MSISPTAGSKRVKEEELEWGSKSKKQEQVPCSPTTAGQAKLNAITLPDPSHAHAYYRWVNLLRTTEKHWTDFELAEAFITLTVKIGETNERLRETPATEPGEPWLEEWKKNRKRAGKRDAISEELKMRAQNRATLPYLGVSFSSPSSVQPVSTILPAVERDPFADE